jgi:hypothetical protein
VGSLDDYVADKISRRARRSADVITHANRGEEISPRLFLENT